MSKYEITTDKGTYEIETSESKPTLGERFRESVNFPSPIESAGSALIDAPAMFGSHFINQLGLGYPELLDKSVNDAGNIFGRKTPD